MSLPEANIDLEVAACLLAAQFRPRMDVDAVGVALDEVASGVSSPTVDGLRERLFGPGGFRGNTEAYYEPENSFLDVVLERRTGIPISLSLVTLSVGRRLDLCLEPVAMPGHFLVGVGDVEGGYLDPFGGGSLLELDGVRALFHQLHGPDVEFCPSMLTPVGPRAVIRRMLNNLVTIYASRRDHRSRLHAVQLRAAVPGSTLEERAEVAVALAAVGSFGEAARTLEALAPSAPGPVAGQYEAQAWRWRSRLN